MLELSLSEVNRSITASEIVHVAKIKCQVFLFFIYFENSTPNIEIRRVLCYVYLIKVSRKRKVVIMVFEMYLWRRFLDSELSLEMDHFIMKQIIFPPTFI
jgi:hypothetical protein